MPFRTIASLYLSFDHKLGLIVLRPGDIPRMEEGLFSGKSYVSGWDWDPVILYQGHGLIFMKP